MRTIVRSPLSWLPLAVLLSGCAAQGGTRVVKLAHTLDTTHPVHRAMVMLGERLAQKSGGTMRLDIYPGGQLGSERETLELLQIGSLGMTKVSSSVLEGFAPAFRVFGLPFLFRDDAHRFAVLEGPVGRQLLDEPERFRLRGLTYYDAGSRSFYTTSRAVRTPADLAGLKIRTQESAVAMQMVRTLGGAATPIAWGEVYTALQQGVVDGAENNPPSFHLSRHYEVARYFTLNEHTAVPDVLVVATEVWEDLSPQQRRWLQEAADESAVYQRRLWREATEEALREVEKAGVQIIRPDKRAFAERGARLLDSFRGDPEVGPLIQSIQAVR